MNQENVKKMLCCIAALLKLTRTNGNVKHVPALRTATQNIVNYVAGFDSDVTQVPSVNGRKGVIGACEALSDAIGRGGVHVGCDIPQNLVNDWAVAADKVIYG